ncbi:MAG TPA: ABC transporter permease, partial [Terriglobales bacterium]|nr:ABC transporter permease [Terriglobales bacterium]
MRSLLQDFRYGLRTLLKTRSFTAVALLTLGLGIGANTAIFSVVNAVLLRPLAMVQPQRVMLLQEVWQGREGNVSVGNFSDVHDQNTVFAAVSASVSASFNLATADAPERIDGERVSADYFATFGVQPLRGRVIAADENVPGHNQVALISERLWRTRFQSDPGLIGRNIQLNGVPTSVIGIMPKSFDPLLSDSDIWTPAAFTASERADHDNHYLVVLARLKPGVSIEKARAELAVM